MIRGDPAIKKNVITMVLIWVLNNFAYFLIAFQLNNVPGDLYTTVYISDVAEIIANVLALICIGTIGLKPSFYLSLTIASIGGLLLIVVNPGVDQ
jgi:hypothetical protein